jgi:eukaryotic-like serine/threonine-protein kinase
MAERNMQALAGRAAPKQLGRYRLSGVLAEGSMGVLHRSVDPRTGRPVAVKTVRRDLLDSHDTESLPARFRIEAQAAGALTHPGIVAVYEYGEQEDYAYIVMEHIEGRSLQECFEQRASFSVARAVSILSQLLDALQYAHDRGVWHRDVKPANILITSHDQVKLTDFGIARTESPALTQMGAIMGTPGYIAPETYLSDTFDSRIDVFAAGAVLYQLLAGAPPFVGTAEAIMVKVCYETPVPPSVAGRLPSLQPFDVVVLQALARRPEDRFASAALFRETLQQTHLSWSLVH